MLLAPIALFVYNRPHFTLRTLESLHNNDLANESELFIYADGPKENAQKKQLDAIAEVRQIIKKKQWCKKVTVIDSAVNKGLGTSIIQGVNEIVNEYDRIIVIEDDVLLSRYFLRFMNEGLEKYKDENKVLSLGSWNYYYNTSPADTYFIRLPDTIAWATWKRAWSFFETDTHKLYRQLTDQGLLKDLNLDDRFPFEEMLKQQLTGKVNSWAIRWTATSVIHNTVTLYPSRSLSKHIGFGADSTHVRSKDYNANLVLAETPIEIKDIPLMNNQAAIDAFIHFEKHIRPLITSYTKKITHLAKNFLNRLSWRKR